MATMRPGVIRSVASGLVLDASQYGVRLQTYTSLPSQVWMLESLGDGKFVIVNNGNGSVLDVQGGDGEDGGKAITSSRHGGSTQQWFINSDSTIVSATGDRDLALDVSESDFAAGTEILTYPKHGEDNQQFNFQFI